MRQIWTSHIYFVYQTWTLNTQYVYTLSSGGNVNKWEMVQRQKKNWAIAKYEDDVRNCDSDQDKVNWE